MGRGGVATKRHKRHKKSRKQERSSIQTLFLAFCLHLCLLCLFVALPLLHSAATGVPSASAPRLPLTSCSLPVNFSHAPAVVVALRRPKTWMLAPSERPSC